MGIKEILQPAAIFMGDHVTAPLRRKIIEKSTGIPHIIDREIMQINLIKYISVDQKLHTVTTFRTQRKDAVEFIRKEFGQKSNLVDFKPVGHRVIWKIVPKEQVEI